ncbi:hypothetical protein KC19_2G157400 [Ceratodon purpureus]|uniref:Uncharacterized protein n=1 Tax=Ceratodon purpureus TaxID=3225 RepID=A0A8T0IVW2_CERPU|nr:hypothetical protein KC19_2G157400 [Ceratodon purpureus]
MISHMPVDCCLRLLLYVVLPFWLLEHTLIHPAISCVGNLVEYWASNLFLMGVYRNQ